MKVAPPHYPDTLNSTDMGTGSIVAIVALGITVLGQIVTVVIWGTRLTVAVTNLQQALTTVVEDLTDAVTQSENRHEAMRVAVTDHEVRISRHDEQIHNHDRRLKSGGL